MICLSLLISVVLVACSSDDNNDKGAEQEEKTTENTEENADKDDKEEAETEAETKTETEDVATEEDTASEEFDFDPNGENTVTLKIEQEGVVSELTYTANGDKVTEQTANNEITYESLGVTNSEEAEEVLAEFVEGYGDTAGVTHSMDYQEDKAIETLTINYETADLEAVSELNGSTFEGDLSQGISLKNSVNLLLQEGFEIVD